MYANIDDIVVLDNGLKMRLVEEADQRFKTIDITDYSDCTTGHLNPKDLQDFYVGGMVYGNSNTKYEIIDIIRCPSESKPPLGVMPRNIYELQRVQDICRALNEYTHYEKADYALMIQWAEELVDRLYILKSQNE